MNRKIVLTAVMSLLSIATYAQGLGLSRQVEVTKDYVPDVSLATKLYTEPRFGDTTALRPDIGYSLEPVPMRQTGEMALISPARVSSAVYESESPIWIKAGGGFPANTQLDFYGVNTNSGSTRWGGYVNHKGLYPNLTNDYRQNVSSAVIKNKVGLFGRTTLGRNDMLVLEGEGGYIYDYFARYAYMHKNEGSPKQHFSIPYFGFSFGHEFKDFSYWNFRVGGSIYYLTDKYDIAERGIKPFVEVGKSITGSDRAILRVDMENYEARTDSVKFGAVENYKNTIVRVSPSYEYFGGNFKLKLGAKIVMDNLAQNGFDTWVFPDLRAEYDLGSGKVVPFVEATGDIYNNGVRNTMERSPYYDFVTTDFNSVENTRRIDLRGGIGGNLGSHLNYKAYIGYSSYKRLYHMSYYDATSMPVPFVSISFGEADNLNVFVFGAQVNWRIAGRLDLMASVCGYSYDTDGYEKPLNMPSFDANLSVKYKFSDRISAWANADVLGKRYFRYVNYSAVIIGLGITNEYVSVDPVVDLGLGVDFKINHKFAIFAQGNNLTGSKLYLDPHYPSVGATFTAGIKINF